MQYNVEFLEVQPAINRSRDFAQYHLSKIALGNLLVEWPQSVRWTTKSSSRKTDGKYHPTAISRTRLSAPIREYLTRVGRADGKVLYHGVGRDEVGAKALLTRGSVVRFDPYHPDAEVRRRPVGYFDEVHSHYTLNVVDAETGRAILTEIYTLLTATGFVIVTVRRDLDRRRKAD